jgi:phage protein D
MVANLSRLLPFRKVRLDGEPLDIATDAALAKVEVDLDKDLFGQCTLLFVDPELELINGERFSSGLRVTVELGFIGQLRPVFEGEVVALEPRFLRDKPPALQVVCQDSLHRLALSQMTRAFNDVDDGEMVQIIAREHGLRGEGPSGSRGHELQSNVSDAAFLRRMAQKHGHELRIEQGKLLVGPPPRGEEIAIEPGAGLRKLQFKINAKRQVGQVTAHGWDPATRREITATARPQGITGEGAERHGGAASIALAGEGPLPRDTASAETMAKARLRKLAEGFVTARMELIGDPRAVPGAMLKVDKIDPAADGTYRVERARHQFSRHGYFMRVEAARTAKKRTTPARAPAVPPEHPEPHHIKMKVFHPGTQSPVNGARWEITGPDGAVVRRGQTGPDGMIAEAVPAAGMYQLRLLDPPTVEEAVAAAGAGETAWEAPVGTIWAQLLDGEGRGPLRDVEYRIEGEGTSLSGRTDAEGKLRHASVPIGDYGVEVEGGSATVSARRSTPAEAEPALVRGLAPAHGAGEPVLRNGC